MSNYTFSNVPRVAIPRSSFSPTHHRYQTMDTDYLYPIYCKEYYPGDTLKMNVSALIRLVNPAIVPIMDDMYLDIHFFAVPHRILWTHWVNFQGEREDIDSWSVLPDYTIPQISSGENGFEFDSLADYLRLRPGVGNYSVSALPFRAYNKIYNAWYRDENFCEIAPENLGDTGDTIDMYSLKKRAKIHDYFTSALPSPQKGPEVIVPIGTSAPVVGNGLALGFMSGTGTSALSTNGSGAFSPTNGAYGVVTPAMSGGSGTGIGSSRSVGVTTDPSNSGLIADLSAVTGSSINLLRTAWQTQKQFEKDARSGTRYTEIILGNFGVHTGDARLQRPELLFAGSERIFVNPVAQTSGTTSTSAQGNLSSFLVGTSHNNKIVKSFTEHTFVIGIASIRANNIYQQGIPREFSRQTRFDYYLPGFAHLGEQAILNKEIFVQGTDADNDVFGYQERWAEERYEQNEVCGKMRSDYPNGTLDVYHLGQQFTELPVLNQSFIESETPIGRVVAVPSEPSFVCDFYFDSIKVRPMPLYSVPGLVDHF